MDETLNETEEVILALDDHWVVLLKPVLFVFFGSVLAFFFHNAADLAFSDTELMHFLLYFLSYFTLLVSVHFFFILMLQWIISSIVITTNRLIEINYAPFMIDDVTHVEVNKINEIEKKKHGLLRNILNYGDVNMSIAGMKLPMHLTYVRKPSKFVNLIEAVKLGKPLENIDLRGMGANFSEKYAHLKM